MKIHLTSAVAVLLLLAPGAFAQTANSASGSVSGASARSSTASSAVSNTASQAGSVSNSSPTATAAPVAGATNSNVFNSAPIPTTTTQNDITSGTTTIKNTPSTVAPNIFSGSPCAVGAAIGGSGPGFGLSLGYTSTSDQCEQRMRAGLLLSANTPETTAVAKEILCLSEDTRTAFKMAGYPCQADKPVVAQPPVVVAAAPAPQAPLPVRMKRYRPDFCNGPAPSDAERRANASWDWYCTTP